MRENIFQEWWSQCDRNRNEVFVLACKSQSFNLAEHILRKAFTQHHQEKFLESIPAHILKSLAVHRKDAFDKKFMVSWLRLLRQYVDKIPQKYTIETNDTDGDPLHKHYHRN